MIEYAALKNILDTAVNPALAWMGGVYHDQRAAAMLLAICHTESGCEHRRQIRGPARSFLQIEPFTAVDVLKTRPKAAEFWSRLHLPPPVVLDKDKQPVDNLPGVRDALEYSDFGAVVIARELLWFRLRKPLPDLDPDYEVANEACGQYLAAWRPGKPHPERFVDVWPLAVAYAKLGTPWVTQP